MTTTRVRNWAGNLEYSAERVARPGSVDELRELVRGARRVRALGTRHSFSDVADGPGLLVSTELLPAQLEVAADRRTATVSAGSTYAVVATALEAQGLALLNTGSLPHISVGGAISTGTHGSGLALGSLASQVAAVQIVGADGSLRRVARGDADFGGSVLALGAVGVVVAVELDVQPSFRMRQDTYLDLPWSAVDDSLVDVLAAGYSVSLFHEFDETVRELLVKTRVPEGRDDVDVPDELFGARRRQVDEHERVAAADDVAPSHMTPMDGTVGAWPDRLPHFRIDATPSVGSELQSEHFVPLEHGAAALRALQRFGADLRPHLHTCETRVVAGDDQWLSPTPVDSLAIAFTWKDHPREVGELVPRVERALGAWGPRPHWGKLSSMPREQLAVAFPRLDDFASLVARVDPEGAFRGPYLERLLG
ncbi:FAD-binding protein [Frigoribacterium salinisoli]